MSLSAGTPLGPYEIVGLLGAGGMGEVYRASDTRLKRDVALKVIADSFAHDKSLIVRFQREAELLATLTHQHIAAVYGLEEIDGGRALVMELAEGETLAQRLIRGALPLDEALPIARQIADALEYAHDHGILHRDLKPANIKVGSDGHVKILDFGLAKAMNAPGSGAASNLESPTIDNADAQWSANTAQLLFGRGSEGRVSFLIRDLASTTERPIAAIAAASGQWPTDWSSDGTKVMFSENNLACVVAGLNGSEPKTPIRYSGAFKCQFSPNGKYISYVDAVGIGSVVVEPLPPNGARWQIPSESASEPRWHPNGKELFFLDADQTLISSEISLDPEFKAGPPRPLFRTRIPAAMRAGVAFNYDVAPDGRFLINTVKPGTEPQALHVILNWRPQGAAAGTR